jgi:Ca2+-binding EF-hand superfamily protein
MPITRRPKWKVLRAKGKGKCFCRCNPYTYEKFSLISYFVAWCSGIGMGQFLLGSAVSWFVGGKFHAGRVAKKLKAKHQKEQKALYSQYYNDVYKLSEQNQELLSYVETLQDTLKQTEAKHELEAIQRDYDEFKQPDIDGDDRISRAEFNMYVKNYLSNYPGLTEADYPKFEDFDRDGDGYVSFKEYAQQMALQSQQAELDQLYGKQQHQGLQDLYKDTAKQAQNVYR